MKIKQIFKRSIIALIIFLLAGISISYAINNAFVFTKTSSTKEQVSPYTAQLSKLYSLKNGVLKVDYEGNVDEDKYNDYRLTYLNKNGEIIRSEILDLSKRIAYISTDGKNIYYTYYDRDFTNPYVLAVLDENFNLLNQYYLNLPYSYNNVFRNHKYDQDTYRNNYITRFNDIGFYPIVSNGENIYIEKLWKAYYTDEYTILKINADSTYALLSEEDTNQIYEEYFPLLKKMYEDCAARHDCYTDRYLYVNDNKILSSSSQNDIGSLKLTEGEETLWEITNEENTYYYYSDLEAIGDYIVTIADYKPNGEYADERSDILVYDLEGNLVQKISNNSEFTSLEAVEDGFIVNRYYTEGICNITPTTSDSTYVSTSYVSTGGRLYTTSDSWDSTNCKSYLYTEKYTLSDSLKNDNIIEDIIENPNTSIGKSTLLIIIAIVGWIILHAIRNIKGIKRYL